MMIPSTRECKRESAVASRRRGTGNPAEMTTPPTNSPPIVDLHFEHQSLITIIITIITMLSRSPLILQSLQSLKAPTRTSFKRFNSSVPGGGYTGRNYIIPLAVAGIAGGSYYFYRSGVETPVAASFQPPNPVLTNPDEWIDFKVEPSPPCHRPS
jgi:hypothetical protein